MTDRERNRRLEWVAAVMAAAWLAAWTWMHRRSDTTTEGFGT